MVPAAAVGLAPAVANAQFASTGVLTGTVTDAATKKPLGDVVVEVSSPAMQGEQIVITDGSGSYRIPNLPPGAYTIRVNNDGYRAYSAGGITLNANQTIRANVSLAPLTMRAEEVVVVGKAPTVDIGSAQTGTTITKEFTSRIPLARPTARGGAQRSFESVAAASPQASGDQYGTSINGTTSPENQYIIDGLSVNSAGYGTNSTPLSIEFIKEVGVITGGYLPEYGRSTGGILNVVTKSGSNEFHGSVWLNFSPGGIDGDRTQVQAAGQTIATNRRNDLVHDFGADIGGPIVKDRLWFYGGVGFNSTRVNINQRYNRRRLTADGTDFVCVTLAGEEKPCAETVPADGADIAVEQIPGTTDQVRPAVERGIQYFGKLTLQLNKDNNIELSINGSPASSGGDGTWGVDPSDGSIDSGSGDYTAIAHRYATEPLNLSLKWSSAFDNKTLLLDATLGWSTVKDSRLPSDGSTIGDQTPGKLSSLPSVLYQRSAPINHTLDEFVGLPAGSCAPALVDEMTGDIIRDVQCPTTTYFAGGPDFIDTTTSNRYQGRLVLTKLFQGLGHHIVKAGIDIEQVDYTHTKAYSGHLRFAENGSGSAFNVSRQYGFLTAPDTPVSQDTQVAQSTSTTVGAFLQDAWNIMDKVQLNLGVRYDGQFMFGADGKLGIALGANVSPRIGIIYDITQQGRSKIFANYARYFEQLPLDLVDRSLPGEAQIGSRTRAQRNSGPNDNLIAVDPPEADPIRCDPKDPEEALGECQTAAVQASRGRVFGNTFDPNQYYFQTGAAKVPIDPNLQPQSLDEIVVGGEYEIFSDARIGAQYVHRNMVNIIEDMSRDEATTYFIGNPGSGIAKDFPVGKRDYDGVTIFFMKNPSDKWLAQVSYTLAFLRGNIAGLYRPETGQLDPNINSDFDLQSLTINREGPLPGDTTHTIKVYAARDFPFNEFFNGPDNMQINLGIGYNGASGGPTSFLGAHPIYGGDEVHILPRGSGQRLPFVHRFDGRIQYDLKLGKDTALSAYMDVFNIFNFQEVTAIDETYTFQSVQPIKDGQVDPTTGEPDPTKIVKIGDAGAEAFDPATDRNPNFGKPSAYQQPRQFRFGVRVSY